MEEKVSIKAIPFWRILYSIIYLFMYILLGVILYILIKKGINVMYIYITLSLFIILIIYHLLDFCILIPFRQKNFSFFINKRYLKIIDGRFFRSEITIPMSKIYYVDVRNGPLKNKFGIRKLQIGTLANEYEIPCINMKDVNNIKNRITLYSDT